jgi:methionyl-tRNA formyltransferase
MARLYLLFADEPVFHPAILRELVADGRHEIVGVGGVRHRRRGQQRAAYVREQLGFWGVRGFATNAGAVIHARLRGKLRQAGGGRAGGASLRAVCRRHGIDYEPVDDVNSDELVATVRAREIDVIVSSQGQIFREPLLAAPRLGCLNRHSGLLPSYGGLKPVFWALLHGERWVGVSVHEMELEIDAGRVLAQAVVPVTSGCSLYGLYRAIFRVSGQAILDALDVLEGRRAAPAVSGEKTYFGEPTRSDVARFRALGLRMV